MFNTFIYFIIVLLIWSTYQPSLPPTRSPYESLFYYLSLFILLTLIAKFRFSRLETQSSVLDRLSRDHKLTQSVTALSLLSLFFTALNIYLFEVTTLFLDFPPFNILPVLKAAFILLTLIGYLVIIWTLSHPLRQHIYSTPESNRTYILHQLSFATPLILPWFIMTGVSDIIMILPFDGPRRFLLSSTGEISYLLLILLILSIAGPGLVQKLWRCKPLEAGPDRARIERLIEKAKLEYRDILSWPIFGGMMMTAGIMGIVKRFRYILVTPALLTLLSPDEVDSVVAHEIGHAKKKHLLFYLMFFIGYTFIISMIWDPLIHALFYSQPNLFLLGKLGLNQTAFFSAGLSIVAVILFLVYFRVIFGYFMRNFERQADIYVYELMENASHLIKTFSKIVSASGQSADTPNWHHFSISERVQFLKKCEEDRSHINRHNAKIRNSILAYLAGLLILSGSITLYPKPETIPSPRIGLPDISILNQLHPNQNNAELFIYLGDAYFQAKKYDNAIFSYESALKANPSSAHALNNLAWLLATCEDKKFINPAKALELAKKAADLETSPYVLDTLAESYFINGMIQEAVAAEKKALDLGPDNKAYYDAQLKKFMNAKAVITD